MTMSASAADLFGLPKVARLHDFARHVAAEHVRHGEFHAGNSGAHEKIEVIQRAGPHPHQNLIGLDAGLRRVFIDPRIRAAVKSLPGIVDVHDI